jgi:O-antigen/teichoic acid export membrane protein
VQYVTAPLVGVLTPALVLVKTRASFGALQDAQASLTRIIWLLVLPAGVGLAFLAKPLVAALYPEYTEAGAVAVVFVAFVFAEPLLSVPQTVAMVFDRYRAVLASRALALASIPLLAWLTPRFGLQGAAVAVGVARLLPLLALTFHAARTMGLRPPLAFLARVAASSLGMALALGLALSRLALPSPGASLAARLLTALPLLAIAGGGALVFLVLLHLLGGLEPEDRRRLLALRLPARGLLARLL